MLWQQEQSWAHLDFLFGKCTTETIKGNKSDIYSIDVIDLIVSLLDIRMSKDNFKNRTNDYPVFPSFIGTSEQLFYQFYSTK